MKNFKASIISDRIDNLGFLISDKVISELLGSQPIIPIKGSVDGPVIGKSNHFSKDKNSVVCDFNLWSDAEPDLSGFKLFPNFEIPELGIGEIDGRSAVLDGHLITLFLEGMPSVSSIKKGE